MEDETISAELARELEEWQALGVEAWELFPYETEAGDDWEDIGESSMIPGGPELREEPPNG